MLLESSSEHLLLLDRLLIKSIFTLSPATALQANFSALALNCTRHGTRILYGYTTPTLYSHPSRLVLTDRHTNFNFFLKAVAVYSLLSALLSPMWRLSPFIPMFAGASRVPAILIAVAPLSVLESDAKLILFLGIQKYI